MTASVGTMAAFPHLDTLVTTHRTPTQAAVASLRARLDPDIAEALGFTAYMGANTRDGKRTPVLREPLWST